MSASLSGSCLPPSSNLPPIRQIVSSTEQEIATALRRLQTLYCPLRIPLALSKRTVKRHDIPAVATPVPVDSGYASQDEDEDDDAAHEEAIAALRADPFERTFATRWLTALIARSEEMEMDDDVRSRVIDDAASVLASFSDSAKNEEEEALTRDFDFPTACGASIKITLNDAPLSSTDHTDVGLQSWGASIVLSSMMCADPGHFGLREDVLPQKPTLIELGAGTGLVSLTLAKLFPTLGISAANITATDYHPAVLENCEANIATNFSSAVDSHTVTTSLLDWSQPPAELAKSAGLLIASDVVYAPEHAAWLRDCAAHLITPDGTFWLMTTVRKTGKFEGIPDTVDAAFDVSLCPLDAAGRKFQILQKEWVDKRRGIGRGDESGYNLYRIGWA
ncbi:hypothetical protein NX059_009224 [Plenodomus lindquistii]|nr:hypothetical protein NX059_009224 [Plenodomus lindquistii]